MLQSRSVVRRQRGRLFVAAGVAAAIIVAVVLLYVRDPGPDERIVADVVESYCTDCHNGLDRAGGFAFEPGANGVEISTADATAPAAAIRERSVRKVRAGLMPPAEAPRPEPAVLARFSESLEAGLDRAWDQAPDPGAEPLSRLNRVEYVNAVRDLLQFDAAAIVTMLPADEVVAGFDNIGEALSVSPTLIEAYVAAAMRVSREAVGDRTAVATQVRYEPPAGLTQDAHIDGLPLGTRGGFVFTHQFPLDATYEIRVAGSRPPGIATQSFCPGPQIVAALNGVLLAPEDPRSFTLSVPAGPQTLAVALVDTSRCAGVNELHDVYATSGAIRFVEIHGPFDPSGPGDTPSRRAIFSCYPQTPDQELPCAREILRRLATLAYRRPLDDASEDIATLLDFFGAGRSAGGFEHGVQRAIARILMSPQFVFQLEREPEAIAPGEVFRLSDLEIASRLAFFLWSSLPDSELIGHAATGRLSEAGMLDAQVSRMLADPRAGALIDNFVSQWLSLRELRAALPQDREFDANLRLALEQETRLLTGHIIENDLSVLELLDADYTFVNERLARHYGIDGVRGSHMRRVALDPDSVRRGLLGHGSWLTATSVADRTSPVIRGEWFITHLLGAPVPEPPAGVEADLSDEAEIARAGDTLRERLERHRANPTCAACHRIMDPIGLALENFDLVGRWRVAEQGKPIDASAVLIDGTAIDGPADLRQFLLSRPELFVTALTEKLLSYALGRVVDHRDMPAVRRIVREAETQDYRFSALVRGVAKSAPFLMRTKAGD